MSNSGLPAPLFTCSGKRETPRWAVSFLVRQRVVAHGFVLNEALQLTAVDLIHHRLFNTPNDNNNNNNYYYYYYYLSMPCS